MKKVNENQLKEITKIKENLERDFATSKNINYHLILDLFNILPYIHTDLEISTI